MSKNRTDKSKNPSPEELGVAEGLGAEKLSEIAAVLEGAQAVAQEGTPSVAGEASDVAADATSERDPGAKHGTEDDSASRVADVQSQRINDKINGKFRNPEELLRAYNELEKEFTRRSQKLAEAERRLKESAAPYAPREEEWKATVDKFFENPPSAKPFAKDMAREILAHPELKEDANCLNNALTRVLAAKFRTPEQLLSDGEFLKDYVLTSTAVKAAVVEEYLKGLRENRPPAVMRDGGQFGVTAGRAPRSIEEAGDLFLKENKQEKTIW